jgi:hypothetical protein
MVWEHFVHAHRRALGQYAWEVHGWILHDCEKLLFQI